MLAVVSLALQGSPARQPKQITTESSTRSPGVVTFDLVVTDSHGQAVSGLNASDFRVFEDKQEQKLELCRSNGQVLTHREPNRPNEFSNRFGPSLRVPTVILLDLLNARFTTSAHGWIEATDAIEGLESPERVSLYLLTTHGELSPIQSFSRADTDVALGRPSWTKTVRPTLDAAARSERTLRPEEMLDPGLRFDITFRALHSLAAQLAGIPGRKNLIWITHGVPITLPDVGGEMIDMSPQVTELASVLARAHVAVYTVDQSSQGAGGGFDISADLLRMLARLAGGRAFGSDYVARAINQARTDARISYTIAYDRPVRSTSRKYHRLHVTCLRPGVSVFAPQGYYDDFVTPANNERMMVTMGSAARATLDVQEIGLTATVSRPEGTPHAVHVQVLVDTGDVVLIPKAGRFRGQLSYLFAIYGEDGLIGAHPPAPLQLELTPGELQKALKNGIEFNQDIDTGTDAQRIRCIVVDRNMDRVGSVTVPVPPGPATPATEKLKQP